MGYDEETYVIAVIIPFAIPNVVCVDTLKDSDDVRCLFRATDGNKFQISTVVSEAGVLYFVFNSR